MNVAGSGGTRDLDDGGPLVSAATIGTGRAAFLFRMIDSAITAEIRQDAGEWKTAPKIYHPYHILDWITGRPQGWRILHGIIPLMFGQPKIMPFLAPNVLLI